MRRKKRKGKREHGIKKEKLRREHGIKKEKLRREQKKRDGQKDYGQ